MRLILVMLILVGSTLFAAENDPEAATRVVFQQMQVEGLTAIVRHTHPEELEKFKAMVLPVYEAEHDAGGSDLLAMTFGELATITDAREASGAQFMQAFIGFATELGDSLGGMNFDSVEILGSVPEGNDIVHVVVRTTVAVGGIRVSGVEVMSWRKYQDEWRAMLSGEMEGMAQQIRMLLNQ